MNTKFISLSQNIVLVHVPIFQEEGSFHILDIFQGKERMWKRPYVAVTSIAFICSPWVKIGLDGGSSVKRLEM